MKWICRECSWTGDRDEIQVDSYGRYHCPECDGEADVSDEPDPLDEHNADYVRDGLQAVRNQL